MSITAVEHQFETEESCDKILIQEVPAGCWNTAAHADALAKCQALCSPLARRFNVGERRLHLAKGLHDLCRTPRAATKPAAIATTVATNTAIATTIAAIATSAASVASRLP